MDIQTLTKELNKHGFRYISMLGNGGFGIVVLAEHYIDKQKYAIKKLLKDNPDEQDNLLKEIQALASLNHPNIIHYKTSFKESGSLFLVMEYCKNGTLLDMIHAKGTLEINECVKLFLILTKTFAELHNNTLIHHDIKPSNILLDAKGQPRISDFGCVNTSIGTIIYSAPEHYADKNAFLDPRVDIYSLGITLIESLVGFNPLWNIPGRERLIRIKNGDFPIASFPYWLQEIILRSCHFYPESRFQSMEEFHKALIEKDIPKFLTPQILENEEKAKTLKLCNARKRWEQARRIIEANSNITDNLNFLVESGKYYLAIHKISLAKERFEQALRLNTGVSIEKEMAEVYLQSNEPAKAAALLTNYLNRNFYDPEAHNQLLHAFFLSDRFDHGLNQSVLLRKLFPRESIFTNNHVLFDILVNQEPHEFQLINNVEPFSLYNFRNVFEQNTPSTWSEKGAPSLKTKVLFQEFKFRDISKLKNELELKINEETIVTSDPIISFGREGYPCNTYSCFPGNKVSRRHFVIINQKNNVWLYDLASSTGVFVEGVKVDRKHFLLGLHEITFGGHTIMVKSDRNLLI
ncbi:MAG: protein kinase [Bacteroidales bacterium]|nr:protein kinase [Bacteroidales bacterium]